MIAINIHFNRLATNTVFQQNDPTTSNTFSLWLYFSPVGGSLTEVIKYSSFAKTVISDTLEHFVTSTFTLLPHPNVVTQ